MQLKIDYYLYTGKVKKVGKPVKLKRLIAKAEDLQHRVDHTEGTTVYFERVESVALIDGTPTFGRYVVSMFRTSPVVSQVLQNNLELIHKGDSVTFERLSITID